MNAEIIQQAYLVGTEMGTHLPEAVEILREYVDLAIRNPEYLALLGAIYGVIDAFVEQVRTGNRSVRDFFNRDIVGDMVTRGVKEGIQLGVGVTALGFCLSPEGMSLPIVPRIMADVAAGVTTFYGLLPDSLNGPITTRATSLIGRLGGAIVRGLGQTGGVQTP